MMPVGPLMIEHRLIERMIRVIGTELARIEKTGKVNPAFVDTAVDFIKTYADACHHGKEERILFRDLKVKPLATDIDRILNELIDEHKKGREVVGRMVKAKERYLAGESGAVDEIVECMHWLVDFYPKHIEKEDRHFFMPCMGYFSKEEKDAMLAEEVEFDREFVHVKYRGVIEDAEEEASKTK